MARQEEHWLELVSVVFITLVSMSVGGSSFETPMPPGAEVHTSWSTCMAGEL